MHSVTVDNALKLFVTARNKMIMIMMRVYRKDVTTLFILFRFDNFRLC